MPFLPLLIFSRLSCLLIFLGFCFPKPLFTHTPPFCHLVFLFSSHLFSSMKARMYNSSAFLKQEFFSKWIKGLRIYKDFYKKQMTVPERKIAIKLSADVAMASTRNTATHWSQALMADVSTDGASRAVVEQISGRRLAEKKAAVAMTCSKKIVRRSRLAARRSVGVARKLVKTRTRVLKRLVPGGQEMDEVLLIKETLDYIASLQVQVDVMRHLAAAAERLDHQARSF